MFSRSARGRVTFPVRSRFPHSGRFLATRFRFAVSRPERFARSRFRQSKLSKTNCVLQSTLSAIRPVQGKRERICRMGENRPIMSDSPHATETEPNREQPRDRSRAALVAVRSHPQLSGRASILRLRLKARSVGNSDTRPRAIRTIPAGFLALVAGFPYLHCTGRTSRAAYKGYPPC